MVAAGLVFIILLTLAASLLSIYSFRRTTDLYNVLANEHVPSLVAIQRLHFLAERKIAAIRGFLLTGDDFHLNRSVEARRDFYDKVNELQSRGRAPEQQALAAITRAEAIHQQVAEQFMSVRKRRSWSNDLIRPYEEKLRPLRIQLDETIDALEKVRIQQYDHERTEIADLSSSLLRILIASSVGLLAILLVLGALVQHFLNQRSQNEKELKAAHNELEKRVQERTAALTSANAELEAFSYSVSHDLRAPLRGIDGFSQALMEDYADRLDETARKYLERIRAGTQRMGALIDDLLTLSRLSRVEMRKQETNLSEIAASIVEELRAAEPQRNVQIAIEPRMVVKGDRGLLKAALQNLISNAWKFTATRPESRIEVGQIQQEGQRVFYVRDNGAGFDMAYSNKLFGAFQRLHKATEYPGTGVGLATVRRIIHRHSGRIWAEGAVGQGATFYFTLEAGMPATQAA